MESSMGGWYRQWGHNIAAWRKARGLSREEFAEAVGVQPETVSRWEHGRLGPRDSFKLKIAAVLEVPPDILFPLGMGGAPK